MAARHVVTSFAGYCSGRSELDPTVVSLAVRLKAERLRDPQPARWRLGDLETVLLELLPRHVTEGPEWLGRVVPTMRAFLQFARSEGLLHRGGAPWPVLQQELDAVERQFPDVVLTRAGWGPWRAEDDEGDEELWEGDEDEELWEDDDGDEPGDDDGDGGRARAEAQLDLLGFPPDPDVLPPTWLPPREGLAATVRNSPLIRDVNRLLTWLQPGRAVTGDGKPDGEVADLAREVGVDDGDGVPGAPCVTAGYADGVLTREWLLDLWDTAVAAGLVAVDGGRARPRRHDLLDAGDDEILGVWATALRVMAAEETVRDVGGPSALLELCLQRMTRVLLFAAYDGEQTTVLDVTAEMVEGWPASLPAQGAEVVTSVVLARLDWVVRQLCRLGAVQSTGPGMPVELSPLGRFGVRELAMRRGVAAPVLAETSLGVARLAALADLAGLDGAGYIAAEPDLPWHLRREVIDAWAAARGTDVATAELIELARTSDAVTRVPVLTLAGYLLGSGDDTGVAQLVAAVGDEPVLGPVARAFAGEERVSQRASARLRELAAPALTAGMSPAAEDAALAAWATEQRRRPLVDRPDELAVLEDVLEDVAAGCGWVHACLTPADQAVMTVETLLQARLLYGDVDGPDVPGALWALVDEALVARVAGCGHPDAGIALEIIGTVHPSHGVRRAAATTVVRAEPR